MNERTWMAKPYPSECIGLADEGHHLSCGKVSYHRRCLEPFLHEKRININRLSGKLSGYKDASKPIFLSKEEAAKIPASTLKTNAIKEPASVNGLFKFSTTDQGSQLNQSVRKADKSHASGKSSRISSYVAVLRNCAKHRDLHKGRLLHEDIMKAGFLEECSDALVTMYAKCGLLTKAKEILNTYPSRDVLSWTALISGYAQKGLGKDALDYFEKMQGAGLSPDAVTFACILKACGSIGAADKGERIHDEIAYQGLLESDVVLGTALVDMYAKCGALGKAQQVFQKLFSRNVITWSALITGYCQHGEGAKAFECYEQMQCENLFPDAKTYACILKACGDIRELDKGEKIHDEILRQGLLDNDIVLGTALVYMYAQCGVLIKAQETFNRLPYRDVTSWSALIEGYTQHGQCEKAMEYFEQMRAEGISPNVVTFTSMLKACAAVGAIAKGEKIHDEISKEGLLGSSILLDTALVDMYAKCGVVSRAHKVLNGLYSRDISTWAALIAGYAQQGHCEQAIICLEQMQEEGLSPDHTIFSSLLNACSHLGRVDEGHMYFALLTKRFGVKPDLEHYTCIVDLLGRAGHIDKAVRVIQEMPYSNNIEVWSALLAACRQWGNTYIGKWAFEHAVQLDKKNTAAYVIMADLYASAAMREDAKGIQVLGVENEA